MCILLYEYGNHYVLGTVADVVEEEKHHTKPSVRPSIISTTSTTSPTYPCNYTCSLLNPTPTVPTILTHSYSKRSTTNNAQPVPNNRPSVLAAHQAASGPTDTWPPILFSQSSCRSGTSSCMV